MYALGARCCRSVDMIGDGDEILNFQCLSPRVGVNAHIAKISIREGVFEIVAQGLPSLRERLLGDTCKSGLVDSRIRR